MKEIITAPTTKIKSPIKNTNLEKTVEKPMVSLLSTTNEIPNPIFSLKRRRKRVDATHSVRLATMRLV
jgi:hypothetical protein